MNCKVSRQVDAGLSASTLKSRGVKQIRNLKTNKSVQSFIKDKVLLFVTKHTT